MYRRATRRGETVSLCFGGYRGEKEGKVWKGAAQRTAQTANALAGQPAPLLHTVRAVLMQDAANGNRIRQQLGDLTHAPLVMHRLKLAGVHEGIPVGHVDDGLGQLIISHVKLGKGTTRMQVVVVLVDFAELIAYLQVGLVVFHPVLLAAVHRHSAVGAFKVDVRRGEVPGLSFRLLGGLRRDCRDPRGPVVGMRAVGVLPHEGSAAPDLRDWAVGERVEQIVGLQDRLLLGLARIGPGSC